MNVGDGVVRLESHQTNLVGPLLPQLDRLVDPGLDAAIFPGDDKGEPLVGVVGDASQE